MGICPRNDTRRLYHFPPLYKMFSVVQGERFSELEKKFVEKYELNSASANDHDNHPTLKIPSCNRRNMIHR